MNEDRLLLLALIFSIIGLVSLFLISRKIEITDTTIEKITKEQIGDSVKITGKVTDIVEKSGFTLFTLSQNKQIKVVAYSNVSADIGDMIEVTGRIEEYEGETELVADKIAKFKNPGSG